MAQVNLEIVLAVFLHHADRLCADALFFALKAEFFRRRCLDVHARKGQFERIRHILPHLRNVGEQLRLLRHLIQRSGLHYRIFRLNL